jgi:hypothetical protein
LDMVDGFVEAARFLGGQSFVSSINATLPGLDAPRSYANRLDSRRYLINIGCLSFRITTIYHVADSC